MNRALVGPIAAAALGLLGTTTVTTAHATQIQYGLQDVFDSSPTPIGLVGGFTFDTATSSFSAITVHFASNPVFGTGTGVFDQNATLYHYVTDQFVANDSFGNTVVLNYGSTFDHPGTYALTQTGPNSISYVFLYALTGTVQAYNVVNGNIAAVPESGA